MILTIELTPELDSKDVIYNYVTKNKFTFTFGMSKPKDHIDAARSYGVTAYPVSYLIGTDRKVLFRSQGFDEAGLRAALEKAGIK